MVVLKVLFLDLDGVLNSHRSVIAFGGMPRGVMDQARWDTVAVGLVRGLCEAGGISIVLSSSWRILHNFADVGAVLDLPIVGATPRLLGCRGNEIAAWMIDHPEPIDAYAILDDDADMLPDQLGRFVQVSGFEGLSWANFTALCGLFGVDAFDCGRSAEA